MVSLHLEKRNLTVFVRFYIIDFLKKESTTFILQCFEYVFVIAALNGWIIFKKSSNISISHPEFIFTLMEELRINALRNRCLQIELVLSLKRKKCAFERFKGQNKTSESYEGSQKSIRGKFDAGTVKGTYFYVCSNV